MPDFVFSKLYNIVSNCRVSCNHAIKNATDNSYKYVNASYFARRRYCSESIMKVLNVAEKHDAAKNIAGYLSRGTSRKVRNRVLQNSLSDEYRPLYSCHSIIHKYIIHAIKYLYLLQREGLSVYNKIFEFNVQLWGQNCQMVMTSVSGHLLGYEFVGAYRKWQGCHPLSLFDAPVSKQCSEENYVKIKKTLEREIRSCNTLIVWTDCDREGENIGFEIIQVCQAVKPNIRIYR